MNHEKHEKHEKILHKEECHRFQGAALMYIKKLQNNTDDKPTIFVLFVYFVVEGFRNVARLLHSSKIFSMILT